MNLPNKNEATKYIDMRGEISKSYWEDSGHFAYQVTDQVDLKTKKEDDHLDIHNTIITWYFDDLWLSTYFVFDNCASVCLSWLTYRDYGGAEGYAATRECGY